MGERLDAYILSYDEIPRSLNAGGAGSRSHWSKAAAEKRKWEGIFMMLLLERKVPRNMVRCTASALLEFRYRNRRDAENYRPAITKPLADTLVKGGYLPDDTADYFDFTGVEILAGVDLASPDPRVKGRLTIKLEPEYAA